jgi:hypothetical protein
MDRESAIKGLRAVADFLEANENIPIPTEVDLPRWEKKPALKFYAWYEQGDRGDEQRAYLQKFSRGFGKVDKQFTEQFFHLKGEEDGFTIDAVADRDKVCKLVATGTRHVDARPERVLPETVIPAEEEHDEPVYTWECGPLLDGTEEPA